MDYKMPKDWFAIQVKPNRHDVAKINLERQGFHVFAPKLVTSKPGKKPQPSNKLLFPGYVFMQATNDPVTWRKAGNTFGVLRLVSGLGSLPAVLPEGFVESIKANCGPTDAYHPRDNLSLGDNVRVISGPFQGMIAEVAILSNSERVGLLLEIVGRVTRTEIARDRLDAVPLRNAV